MNVTSRPKVRSGPAAAELAGVTYRMLGFWHRRGWVTPGFTERLGPSRALRRYTDDDVVRLAALRHLAECGLDVAAWGPRVKRLEVAEGSVVIADSAAGALIVVPAGTVLREVSRPGRWVVFDPSGLRARLSSGDQVEAGTTRKSA